MTSRRPAAIEQRRWRPWIVALLVVQAVFQLLRLAANSRTALGQIGFSMTACAFGVLYASIVVLDRRKAGHGWPNATRAAFRLIDMPSLTPGQLGRWGRWRRGWVDQDGDTVLAGEVKGAWSIAFDRNTAQLISRQPIVVRSDTRRGWCEIELPSSWQAYVASIDAPTPAPTPSNHPELE